MREMLNRLIAVLPALILGGCLQTLATDINDLQSVQVTYLGEEKEERIISASKDPDTMQSLKSWLQENKSGWKRYYVTEPVGKILVSSDNFNLNIGSDWVIARYQSKTNKVIQLVKDIEFNEFAFLY